MDKRTQLYTQLQDASKEQREANIAEHKLRTRRIRDAIVRRKSLLQLKKQTPVPQVRLDFLSIGDSWFEYPLYNENLSFQNNAIVGQSQLGSMGNPPPQILNQALHGQATTAMLSYENQEKMISVLKDPEQWLNRETGLPDAILVSAGGDDLVGDQLAIYLDYGGGGLNQQRFRSRHHIWTCSPFATFLQRGFPSSVIAMITQSQMMCIRSAPNRRGSGRR